MNIKLYMSVIIFSRKSENIFFIFLYMRNLNIFNTNNFSISLLNILQFLITIKITIFIKIIRLLLSHLIKAYV